MNPSSVPPSFEFSSRPEAAPEPEDVLALGQVLLGHFGIEVNPFHDPEAYRVALHDLDPRYQDGKTQSRQELEGDSRNWDENTRTVIDQVAREMGMMEEETRPPAEDTELKIAIGGARQANLERTLQLADDMAAKGSKNTLLVIGSNRPLGKGESENTYNYAPSLPDKPTESDLCEAAALHAKGFHPELDIAIAYAGNARAGTPDVIRTGLRLYTAQHKGIPPESMTVGTNQIFALSTLMDARRIALQYGVDRVYVAGCRSNPQVVARRTPSTYLSEELRTLRAALDLYVYQQQAASSAQ